MKNIFLFGVMLFVLGLATVYGSKQTTVLRSNAEKATEKGEGKNFSVVEIIDYGGLKETRTVEAETFSGGSVLSLLMQTGYIETEVTEFGERVIGIDDIKNGTGDKYWTYYVNGEMGQVGAGEYGLAEGDKVEWVFGVI